MSLKSRFGRGLIKVSGLELDKVDDVGQILRAEFSDRGPDERVVGVFEVHELEGLAAVGALLVGAVLDVHFEADEVEKMPAFGHDGLFDWLQTDGTLLLVLGVDVAHREDLDLVQHHLRRDVAEKFGDVSHQRDEVHPNVEVDQ